MRRNTTTSRLKGPSQDVIDFNRNGDEEENLEISIVVPVFNEKESLDALHRQIADAMEAHGQTWELIFIDDGSDDGSLDILKSVCARDSHVTVIRLSRNMGQTPALSAGFDYARGQVIITMDGDLQNDPEDIPRLLEKLEDGYDIVSGWRKKRKDGFIAKRLPSLISNRVASWLTGIHLNDYGCSLKAYRRNIIKEIRLYGEMHRYIPALASSIGARVAEIEVTHHARKFGRTKYGSSRLVRGLLDLVALKLLLTYMSRPMQIFGTLGLLTIALGGLSGMMTVVMKTLMGTDMTGNPLLYLTILCVVIGIQFISLGFLGEISIRTYHETQGKPIYVVRQVLSGSQTNTDPDSRMKAFGSQ